VADVKDTLDSLASKTASIDDLGRSLKDLEAASNAAMAAGDTKLLLNIIALQKHTEILASTEEKRLAQQQKMQESQKKGIALTEIEIKEIEDNAEAGKKAAAVLESAQKAAIAANEARIKSELELKQAALENFRTNTLTGKAYTALTGQVSKFIGGITVGGLAMKAWQTHVEAAEVRQNILIQSFQGLSTSAGGATDGFIDVGKQAAQMSVAIAGANATAIRMGVDTAVVGDTMTHFARIVGSRNPEALKKLTEGAITVSRALGVTVPEAVEFVQTRMDKFGGTAASALSALNNLRTGAENTNKAFGRTVVRGDDVARTLLDIAKQSNVYAIDQRFVGNILSDNIAHLQATGDSYDLAQRKARAYTDAVTGKAPEWMQALSGADITNTLIDNLIPVLDETGKVIGKKLPEDMATSLEAASPGLTKKVEGILADIDSGKIGRYEGERYIQELTAQTEVGMGSMNKQILKLYDGTHGSLITIAKQFGVTQVEAAGMVEQAKLFEKTQNDVNEAVKLGAAGTTESIAALAKKLGISKELAAGLAKDPGAIKEAVAQQYKANAAKEDALRIEKQAADNAKKREAINADIAKLENLRKNAPVGSADAKLLDQQIATKKQALQDMTSEAEAEANRKKAAELADQIKLLEEQKKKAPEAEKAGLIAQIDAKKKEMDSLLGAEPLKTVEDINKQMLDKFSGYSDITGKGFMALIAENTTTNLLLGGIAVLLAKKLGGLALDRALGAMGKRLPNLEEGLAGAIAKTIGKGPPPGGGAGGLAEASAGAAKGAGKTGGMFGKLKGMFGGKAADVVSEVAEESVKAAGATAAEVGKDAAKAAGAVTGAATSTAQATSKLSKVAGVAGKASKFLGTAGKIASVGLTASAIYASYKDGGLKAAAAEAIPAAAGLAGGLAGGALGAAGGTFVAPGLGTVAGGIAGNTGGGIAGEYIGDKIVDFLGLKNSGGTDLAGLNKEGPPPKDTAMSTATALSPTPETPPTPIPGAATGVAGAATADTGGPGRGSFMGGVNPDGSATLRIENFGQVFASATNMVKRGPRT